MDMHDLELPVLIDPICCSPVNASSPHSSVRGGAVFYFCSETCKALFLADPSRVVVIITPGESRPVPVQPVANVRIEETAKALEPPDLKQNAGKSSYLSAQVDEHAQVSWFRRAIDSWRRSRLERQHVVHTSNELLALYRTISADLPELSNHERFTFIVMARNGCDSATANLVLKNAEESFAQWPVMRKLTLCDVAHYLSVSEFIAAHGNEHWMHSNTDINRIITSIIPHRLCADHKNE